MYRAALAVLLLPLAAAGCMAGHGPAATAASRPVTRNLQAAIDALPAAGGTVRIAPGIYRERLRIGRDGVRLVGTGARPQDVVIVGGESAATTGSIYASTTVHVAGDDFRASNLTFANDWEANPAHGSSQAAALAISGDRAVLTGVRVLGGQDTLYLTGPPGRLTRQMFRDCYIEGHVDFVFGNAATWFDNCQIHGIDHHTVMYTAHSRNAPGEKGGFVFHRSRFTAGTAPGGIYLGRPWRPYARVVLIDSQVDAPFAPGGWREWKPGMTDNSASATYAEYRTTYTRGAPERSRIRQLTAEEAAQWTLPALFNGDIQWIDAP
ncbi:pectinesterase family protein (plasmid) [Croceibacterium sp. TMG7-5b_MA50]|uniref:pectinesterase family protein n=1 Tax=Croceibacterium sp. TMG7-5b_MA50 TaxID=3121290 RepID=UPI003221474C